MRLELLKNVRRVVVKFGTGILTDAANRVDPAQMDQLVAQLAGLQRRGLEVVLVSSGAVGSGMGVLGMEKRPKALDGLQACAAAGQVKLMAAYDRMFAAHGLHVAQVLLTHDDLKHQERHLNARQTLVALLQRRVVPVINENDAVSYTELKFGDNDRLSALVASLLPADLLILLTTVEGVIENFGTPDARLIPTVETIDSTLRAHAKGTTAATATGGMATKIEAARIATHSGIPMIIATGRQQDTLQRLMDGEELGTMFVPRASRLRGRKRWIAFFHKPKGALIVDDGAKSALRENGKSLLPPGVKRCDGEFEKGDVVKICDVEGTEFARGIAEFDSGDIRGSTLTRVEVVHRDNLVVL
ncbi:MAG TPA: glutamate 5-kinase [Verrucomicrobiales bacterium]|nr:glutamate 5-kinase [Verrucomicrobiales bacterium]